MSHGETLSAVRLLVGRGFDVTFASNAVDPSALDVRLTHATATGPSMITFAREVLAHAGDVDQLVADSIIARGAVLSERADVAAWRRGLDGAKQ